eukprot:14304402-Alexandrium_andersonii.AAC.1
MHPSSSPVNSKTSGAHLAHHASGNRPKPGEETANVGRRTTADARHATSAVQRGRAQEPRAATTARQRKQSFGAV